MEADNDHTAGESESENDNGNEPTLEIQFAQMAQPVIILNDIHLGVPELNSEDNDDVNSVASETITSIRSSSSRESSPAADKEENISESNNETVSKKRSRSESEKEDDGQICPICLDNWTNCGDHRICSLKCGHLFGHSCITRWLQTQSKKSCPTCKKKVTKKDIRFIYARRLIAVDTLELEEMKMKIESVIQERNQIQLELSKYICREHALNQEINSLKSQMDTLRNNPLLFAQSRNKTIVSDHSGSNVKLYMDKSLEICQMGGCRVFDINPGLDLIMVNVRSPNSLFAGFGLRKISISQYKPLAFLPLHSAQIRDVSFQGVKILTVSMDKTFKITDSLSNSNICSSSPSLPLWSCCWDTINNNYFYVGTQMGTVLKYDIRNIGSSLYALGVADDMTPVVSVAHVPSECGNLPRDGIVSCKLNSLWFFENRSSEYIRHPLVIDGPFYSMKFDLITKLLLVSSRPNQRHPNSRHTLARLDMKDNQINANCVYTFESSGLQRHLSRSCFVKGNHEYVACHEESCKLLTLWDIRNGRKATSLPTHDPILDINSIANVTSNYLIGLTDKKMLFYKFATEN